ncbi:hypothetical protein BDZ89DRAFT_804402 [Hymenopellis radicata]|nr:hypothetical protein BDZ89DRAFT_804402 [Hymenopellis radicata]
MRSGPPLRLVRHHNRDSVYSFRVSTTRKPHDLRSSPDIFGNGCFFTPVCRFYSTPWAYITPVVFLFVSLLV